MNERESQALYALLAAKNYRDICPEVVRGAFLDALSRHPKLRDAEKAARARLHGMVGAFMTEKELEGARKCLARYAQGDGAALEQALSLHASTRERISDAEAIYARAFEGRKPCSVLDLACGLNPLYLGARGYAVRGVDVHAGMARLINDWALAAGWDVRAEARDLTAGGPLAPSDAALMMKLMPVMERQKPGSAMALLRAAPVRFSLVTFPTRTLSGRGVGMEKNYSEWFEANLPDGFRILDQYTAGAELCYAVAKG